MTVKGTSGKGTSKPRTSIKSSVKVSSRPVAEEPKVVEGKGYDKAPTGSSGSGRSGRSPWVTIGCIVLILAICCIGTLALVWFNGDVWLQQLMNSVEFQ